MEALPWAAMLLAIRLAPRGMSARWTLFGTWAAVGPYGGPLSQGAIGPRAEDGRWPSGRQPAGPGVVARPQAANAVPGTVPPPPELRAAKDPKAGKKSAGGPAETRKLKKVCGHSGQDAKVQKKWKKNYL